MTLLGPYSTGERNQRHSYVRTCRTPLITGRLFPGFAPRRPIGINGSIFAQASPVKQYSFAVHSPQFNHEFESQTVEPMQWVIEYRASGIPDWG